MKVKGKEMQMNWNTKITTFLVHRNPLNIEKTILAMVVVLCLTNSQIMAQIEFKDGQTYNIDYQIKDDVWVDHQASGMETTINLLDGGETYDLIGYKNSHLNISGGMIGGDLLAWHDSQINISGGTIDGRLAALDNSQVDIFGGTIYFLVASYTSQVDIFGGTIGGSLLVWHDSQINISGGTIDGDLAALDNSQVDIFGGTIGGDLFLNNNSILTINGLDFAVDGQTFGYGELSSILNDSYWNEPSRHLTGRLANGDLFDNDFYIGYNASIVLVSEPVPEPATIFLLSLGMLFLRRKK